MKRKPDERIRELEERLEAMVIAVPKEESAYRFYKDLADSTEHGGTRRMFLELAEQELEHKRKLEKFSEELREELAVLRAEKVKET
jgi:rubrerythrin